MAYRRLKRLKRASSFDLRANHKGIVVNPLWWRVRACHAWHARGDAHLMRVWSLTYYTYALPPADLPKRVYTRS